MGDHLTISGGLLQAPLNPVKTCFAGAAARQVFQVGQAPSGPTVIRPLCPTCHLFAEFCENQLSSFCVILLTN